MAGAGLESERSMLVSTKFLYERPTDQQEKDYVAFVDGYEKSLAARQKKTKKREKLVVHTPNVRNSLRRLVPNAQISPCNICADAQYNQLCCYARTCSALVYAATLGLADMTAFFPSLAIFKNKE